MRLDRAAFDSKFEVLLTFLVEAIGVPVLLSLLLLTYSAIAAASASKSEGSAGGDKVIDLGLLRRAFEGVCTGSDVGGLRVAREWVFDAVSCGE